MLFASVNSSAADVAIENRTGQKINFEGLSFIDQNGNLVPLSSLASKKPTILSLIYYKCPDVCGLVLEGMIESLKGLKIAADDYSVVSISIDPTETSSLAMEKRKAVLNDLGFPVDWTFMTGTKGNIESLSSQLGFTYFYDKKTKLYSHSPAIYVLKHDGTIEAVFRGIVYEPELLKIALQKVSDGAIGGQITMIFNSLKDFNQETQRYEFNSKALTVLAVVLSLMIIVVIILFRFDKRSIQLEKS